MEEFVLRDGKPEDVQLISDLIHQNYNTNSLEEACEFFERDLAGGMNYVVAENNGKIAGFASWKPHDRPYHELAELHAIAVDDNFKGKGLSSKIFEKLVEQAKGFYESRGHALRKLYVLTHENNERAIKFYERIGFKKEISIPSHYYHDVNELLLSIYFK